MHDPPGGEGVKEAAENGGASSQGSGEQDAAPGPPRVPDHDTGPAAAAHQAEHLQATSGAPQVGDQTEGSGGQPHLSFR